MDRTVEMKMPLAIAQDRIGPAGESLEGLYHQHGRALYSYALALTGSPEDAEDAVQEVFAGLARQQTYLQCIDNKRAYLIRSARNAAYSILRGRKRRGNMHEALVSEATSMRPALECGPLSAGTAPPGDAELCSDPVMLECFAKLPAEQREVLLLKIVQGLTFREIARAAGISQNTAASRYRYGIEKLRESLQKDSGEDPK